MEENVKMFYQRRKERGLCRDCGKPLDRDGLRCISCNENHNSKNTERREWYRDNGICPRCGKNSLYGDEKSCIECREYEYRHTMGNREKHGKEHYNTVHADWSRKAHGRRIKEGICTRCGKRKADSGYKTCGICRAKEREKKRTKNYTEDRKERYKRGLCFFCDEPVIEGQKVCEKHYKINLKNLEHQKCAEATKRMKNSNNIFYK